MCKCTNNRDKCTSKINHKIYSIVIILYNIIAILTFLVVLHNNNKCVMSFINNTNTIYGITKKYTSEYR